MGRYAEEDLRQVIATYEQTKDTARNERDASLRAFHAAGWRVVELQRVTGYSRETIRQALNPQTRIDVNAGRRLIRAEREREIEGRLLLVPGTLAELAGPTTGTITLPDRLNDSEEPSFDLTKRARLRRMYESVMHKATSVDDLRTWLEHGALVKLWPELELVPRLQAKWERRFPALGRRWSYRE